MVKPGFNNKVFRSFIAYISINKCDEVYS